MRLIIWASLAAYFLADIVVHKLSPLASMSIIDAGWDGAIWFVGLLVRLAFFGWLILRLKEAVCQQK
jgi:hypothetical protein